MTELKTRQKVLSVFLVLLFLLEFTISFFCVHASAAENTYASNVLDDLKKDTSFKLEDYPEDKTRYDLQVIQIAESTDGSLYIYVYNPSKNAKGYRVSYINMSLQNPNDKNLENEIKNKLYPLKFVNSYGTLEKYRVDNIIVSSNPDRHYNIASIYREYDASVDGKDYQAIDNIQYKGIRVAQYWHVYKYNGVTQYERKDARVVNAEITATGTIRYTNGLTVNDLFFPDYTDRHYVAFRVEGYNIQELYDADITYSLVSYDWYGSSSVDDTPTKIETNRVDVESEYISSKETRDNSPKGWFAKTYTWNRIQDVTTFKTQAQGHANENFTILEDGGLDSAQYVFSFAETPYSINSTSYSCIKVYTVAENLGILRLHFLSDEVYYNIGAVSDLVGTDNVPELDVSVGDNIQNTIEDLSEDLNWFYKLMTIIGLVGLIALLSLFSGPISAIFGIFKTAISFIFNTIFSILILPFAFITDLFKRKR